MKAGVFASVPRPVRLVLARHAFIDTLPILMGYVTMGFAAGVLMAAKGGVVLAPVWSGLCGFAFISGTLSFAVVPAMAGGYTLGAMALLALGINFRYAFYGFSLVGRWKRVPVLLKWFLVHSLADEIYALDIACRERDPARSLFYSFCNHAFCTSYWFFGTAAGGIAGAALPIPSRGIEFAMVALFLVIFTDQIRARFSGKAGR